MNAIKNETGAAYLITVLMVALGLGGAAMYSSKSTLESSKAVSQDINTTRTKDAIHLHLSQYSKKIREDLDKKTNVEAAPYNCNKDATLETSSYHYAGAEFVKHSEKTVIVCQTIITGKRVGYLIMGSREVQGRSIASQLFVPFKIPIGHVKRITNSSNVSRKNHDHAEINSNLEKGSEVFLNDVVTTKANARIQFAMKDKTQILIGPNSDFAFTFFNNKKTKGGQKSMYYLLNGYVRALFKKIDCAISDCSGYEIRTRNATLGIRGTEIIAHAIIDETKKEYQTLFSLVEGGPVALLHGRPEYLHTFKPNGVDEKLHYIAEGSASKSFFIKTPLDNFLTKENEEFKIKYIEIDEAEYKGSFRRIKPLVSFIKNNDDPADAIGEMIDETGFEDYLDFDNMIKPILEADKIINPATPWKEASNSKTSNSLDDPNPNQIDGKIELCTRKNAKSGGLGGLIQSIGGAVGLNDNKNVSTWGQGCMKTIIFPSGSNWNCSGWKKKKKLFVTVYKYRSCSIVTKPTSPTTTTTTVLANPTTKIIDYIDIQTQAKKSSFTPGLIDDDTPDVVDPIDPDPIDPVVDQGDAQFHKQTWTMKFQRSATGHAINESYHSHPCIPVSTQCPKVPSCTFSVIELPPDSNGWIYRTRTKCFPISN